MRFSPRLVGTQLRDRAGSRRRERGALVLDSGQWQVTLAGGKTADGGFELIATREPIAGFELAVRGTGAATTLVPIDAGQEQVAFTRVR